MIILTESALKKSNSNVNASKNLNKNRFNLERLV